MRYLLDTINYLSPHLKGYHSKFWNLIAHFNAFNINAIPRLQNVATDLLATSTSRLVPTNNKCSIEFIFWPWILDNITNMRVFDNLNKTLTFLTMMKFSKNL